ncbi:hypothetical protein [Cumulibacter soli]|nr:hypothetical protein [Cumulibacter soli]
MNPADRVDPITTGDEPVWPVAVFLTAPVLTVLYLAGHVIAQIFGR